MAMLESKGQLKDRKTRTKEEMTKRRTAEKLLVRHGEETLRCEDPLHCNKPVDESLKGFGYAATKQP